LYFACNFHGALVIKNRLSFIDVLTRCYQKNGICPKIFMYCLHRKTDGSDIFQQKTWQAHVFDKNNYDKKVKIGIWNTIHRDVGVNWYHHASFCDISSVICACGKELFIAWISYYFAEHFLTINAQYWQLPSIFSPTKYIKIPRYFPFPTYWYSHVKFLTIFSSDRRISIKSRRCFKLMQSYQNNAN
jgi:hypothetical protein